MTTLDLMGDDCGYTCLDARIDSLPEGELANEFQKPAMVWFDLDVPVVVCLQGVA